MPNKCGEKMAIGGTAAAQGASCAIVGTSIESTDTRAHVPPHRHRRGRAGDPRQLRRRRCASRATRSPRTRTAPTRSRAFRTRLPDLALIDIGLADDVDGGFTLCRELRALSPTVPILFLSARDSDFDIVAGLRLGADDYLTKDVSLPHLTARIAALFRRSDLLAAPAASEDVLERGALDARSSSGSAAHWNGQRVDLTLTEFWMVHALARYPGHVKDRDSLMRDARIVVDDSTITSHIKRIRRSSQAIDPQFDRIDTVYGMGYRWNDT